MDDFDSAAGAVAGGDFDRAAADTVNAQQQPARESLYGALLANPDVAARATRLGRKVGLPADLVERNLPEVERDARLNEFDRVLLNSPVTAKWVAADKARARMAHDNLENMTAIEQTLRIGKNIGMAAVSGLNAAGGGVVGLLRVPFDALAPVLDPLTGTILPENPLRRAAEGLAKKQRSVAETAKADMPKGSGNFESGGYSGIASLTRNAAAMPFLFVPGGQGAALATMVAPVGGEAYGEARDKNLSVARSVGYGLTQAGIEYVTEKMPVSWLMKDINAGASFLKTLGRQAVSEVPGEQAATILGDLSEWATLNPEKPFSSYLEARPDAAVQTLVATLIGVGGQTSLVKGVDAVVNRAERKRQEAEQADMALFVDNLNKLAQADKLVARDPETFQQFIAQAAESGPVQQVFIDAQALMQSGVAEQVAAVSPAVATQLREALQTGGQIAIPVEEYAARIAPTEYAQSMADHLKTDPEGFSRAEAQEYLQSDYAQELQAQVERVLGEKQGDETFRASTEAVRANIKAQLTTAGRFTESVNDAYSSMVGNFYAVQAARMGTTPEEMFKRYPLRIGAESIAGQQFDQGRTLQQLRDDLQKQQAGFDAYDAEIRGGIDPDGNKYFGLADKVTEAMDAFVADLEQIPDDSFSLQAKTRDGRLLLVNPSAQKPGHYQLTRFGSDGNPWGDTQYPTKNQAIKDFLDESDASTVKDFGGQLNQSATYTADTIEVDGIQRPTILNQQARGSFNPATLQLTLLKKANLSTALHEFGHFFLEVQADLADQLQQEARIHGADTLKPGEQQLLKDMQATLDWFGVRDLAEWNNLDFEEKRSYHEKFARGFEAYLFEGKAPSIELQGLFQRFRAWMLNVYRDLKALNVELTDEVRGVFDRMVATNEEIAMAEQGRSMVPMLASPEQFGMTPAEFADYQALGVDATNEAIQELQARGLRDLAYSRNARGRIIKQLQKDAAAKRAGVQLEARRDVMSQPIYRAWQFLTGKITADDKIEPVTPPKSDPNVLDETIDSLFVAIAKLGGINKDETISTWGIDPADKPASGVFGKPVWRIGSAGLSLDGMAEALGQYGYLDLDEHGKVDLRDLEEKFRAELGGESIYSIAFDYSGQQPVRAGDQLANPGALSAGRLDLDSLADLGLPPEVVAAVKARRMTARDGLHPDIVAELIVDENGNPLFTSGDELVRQLAVATPPWEAIDALTDQRMLEEFGELSTPEAIERAADIAIHNEVRARFVATELAALEKATGNRKTLASAAKEYAAAMIARLKVRDIKPGQYAAGEVRAAKATAKAIKAGDLATAAAEKRNQLIQNYAARAAYDAQEEVEKGLRYFGRVEKSATIDREYIEQIHALLERYDLRKAVSGKAIDRQASLRTWVQAQLNAGELPLIAESLLTPAERSAYVAQIESRGIDGELVYADDEERIKLLADAVDRSATRSYKELTVEEFRGLVDTIQQIEHLGRLKHKMLTARDDAAYEAVRDEIAGSIATESSASGKNTRTANDWLGQKLQAIKQFGAAHIKVATWARIMDGGKDNGPVWRYFVQPANERASQETTMRAEATEKLDAILRPIMSKVSMADKMGKGKFFPTLNDSLNWQERFTILLNLGNESNTQRLLAGKGWSMAQIMPVLNTFSAEELRAAQAIWDHFEGYRPLIAAKELRVTGKEPEWIPARQIAIKASDGQIVTLRGGYYPVVYDPRVNLKASQHSSAEEAKNLLKASYSAATTRRSFTKSRVEEVHGRPILLNMQGLYSGVNDVIHDLAWHEWVIDANKLLRSNTIDTAIREHYGPEVKREFEKWRDDIVAGNRRLDHAIEKAAGWARQSVTASALTFNIVSAAMQPLGIANSISRVGAHWIGKGIARYVGAPFESTREAQEKSEWMANRARTRFRELNELRNQVQGQTAIKELMGRYGYWMMMRMQMMVDVPTWWGAYEKAIADGHDETTAVNLADQSVKDSQGGGEEVDQSGVERGGPLVKLFTAFYGFMGTTLNTAYLNGKTEKNRAKMAVNMLLALGVPAVVGSLLKSALVPGDDGDDDNLAKKLIIEQLSFLAGLIAFGREFTPLIKAVSGESKGQSYSGPTGLRVIPDTINLGKQAGQGEFDDAFRKAFINVAGDLTGVPSVQINRSITGIKAIADGKTENPFAVAFGFQEKR